MFSDHSVYLLGHMHIHITEDNIQVGGGSPPTWDMFGFISRYQINSSLKSHTELPYDISFFFPFIIPIKKFLGCNRLH